MQPLHFLEQTDHWKDFLCAIVAKQPELLIDNTELYIIALERTLIIKPELATQMRGFLKRGMFPKIETVARVAREISEKDLVLIPDWIKKILHNKRDYSKIVKSRYARDKEINPVWAEEFFPDG